MGFIKDIHTENVVTFAIIGITLIFMSMFIRDCCINENNTEVEKVRIEHNCPLDSNKSE